MSSIATIRISQLRLRTFIGFNEEEKTKKQDVILNLRLRYDAKLAMQSDDVNDAFNYKVLTKQIIEFVENKRFNLLEKMASDILALMTDNTQIIEAKIKIDKPHALRFSDSVSVELEYVKM